jgi:hypothetical protein
MLMLMKCNEIKEAKHLRCYRLDPITGALWLRELFDIPYISSTINLLPYIVDNERSSS